MRSRLVTDAPPVLAGESTLSRFVTRTTRPWTSHSPAGGGAIGAHEDEAAPQALAVEVEVELALGDGLGRVGLLRRRPPPPVPDDDVPAAVLALRDHALELDVLDRVVLDVDRLPAHAGVEGGALGHGPAGQHAVDLEPEVVVQPGGPVALDDEAPARVRPGGGRIAGRFRRRVEPALLAIGLQPVAVPGHAPVLPPVPVLWRLTDACGRPSTKERGGPRLRGGGGGGGRRYRGAGRTGCARSRRRRARPGRRPRPG